MPEKSGTACHPPCCHHGHGWGRLIVLGALGGLYLVGKRQRPTTRQPVTEAIESPAVMETYQRVVNFPHIRALRSRIIRHMVCGRQHLRVLDVGSGNGHFAIALAKRPEVREVIGIDLASDMVQTARHQSEIFGANAQFLQADAASMPFADGEFDLVVSVLSLHHWEDAIQVLREIKRVLAPGGKASIYDLRRDASPLVFGVATLISRYVVPQPVRESGEPLASWQAAYTPCEAVLLAAKAGWEEPSVACGPFWMALETDHRGE